MPLSIIIINHNTFLITSNCIRSIYKHTKSLDFEIILVDNGSTECNPKEFLTEFPGIILVGLPQNIGFGRGNNEGMKIAKGELLLLLNSDTLVFDNAIERAYHFLLSQNHTGLIGCKLLNEDGSEQTSVYIPIRFPLINLLINGNPILHKVNQLLSLTPKYNHRETTLEFQKKSHECEAVSGAFMMLKRAVIEQCGLFDPDFFMYSEETDWCRNRIRKHFVISYYADAAVIHLGGKSANSSIAYKQSMLSSFLYNYKKGIANYILVIFIHSINSFFILMTLPFMKKQVKKMERARVRFFFELLPYLLFDIPAYRRTYGSRKNPLVLKEFNNSIG